MDNRIDAGMTDRTRTRAAKAFGAATVIVLALFVAHTAAASPRLATNLAGATTTLPPPQGFDPITASDAALEQYGFPPRPDPSAEPDAYRHWENAMSRAVRRVSPHLITTKIQHGPVVVQNGISLNWSGYVKGKSVSAKNPGFFKIAADYVVPRAVNNCDGGIDYTSAWIGVDGWEGAGLKDVLQAGTESQASCTGNAGVETYYAWYEWYPNYEVEIDPASFPVAPGDDLYVVVSAISPTQGQAYIGNLNTGDSVTIGFAAPPGINLVGNSAEWVIERPTVNAALATLADYAQEYFSGAAANYGAVSVAPKQGTAIAMQDSSGKSLSVPTLLGATAILFNYQ
jgi:hypothetical protein